MANVKISQLPVATTVSNSDLVPIVQGGVTKQATVGTQMNAVGLWLVDSETFTTSSSFDLSLPSDFTNFRVVLKVSAASTTNETRLQLLLGSTPAATNYTNYIIGGPNSETISGATSWKVGGSYSTVQEMSASFDLIDARLALRTEMLGHTWGATGAGGILTGANCGVHATATAYDGLRFTTSTGTITGTCYVYGYRN